MTDVDKCIEMRARVIRTGTKDQMGEDKEGLHHVLRLSMRSNDAYIRLPWSLATIILCAVSGILPHMSARCRSGTKYWLPTFIDTLDEKAETIKL